VKLKITQDNIDHGLRGSSTSDPVALALKDKGFVRPYVGINEITVHGRNNVVFLKKCPTPPEVLAFLERFDQSLAVEPTSFEVAL
jgi:hypothetical protein